MENKAITVKIPIPNSKYLLPTFLKYPQFV